MSQIWVPPSHRHRGAIEARKAAQEYDANLDFGFNEETQQWCVYLKQGTMAASEKKDFPILGFRDIPAPDEVKRRLYQSDAFRRGLEIMDDLQRHNDDLTTYDHSDADGQTAEAFAWGFEKMGHPNAPTRIFVPGDK